MAEVPVATQVSAATEAPAATSAPEAVTLTVMHNWDPASGERGKVFNEIIEEFMAANPDIKIVQEMFTDSDIPTKVETAFLAGEEPEIVLSNKFSNTMLWLENGVIVPVTDYAKEWGLADYFLPDAVSDYTDNEGNLIAFPLEGFNWPIWYNMDAFKAAGIELPKTQEELISIAPTLRVAGFQPVVVGGGDWTDFNLYHLIIQGSMESTEALDLAANGGWSKNANALKGAKLFVQMRDSGVFVDDAEGLQYETMNAKFFEGQTAMLHGGSWSYPELPNEMQPKIVISGFPPASDSPQKEPVYYGSFNAKGVWITRNGDKKIDAVKSFVQWLYKPENMSRPVTESAMIPPVNNIQLDESKMDPLFVQSLGLPEGSQVLAQPETFFAPEIIEEVSRILREAYIPNGMTAEEILSQIDALYNQ